MFYKDGYSFVDKRMQRLEELSEKTKSLDSRAVEAKNSEIEAETLIKEFSPFLRNQVSKYVSRSDEYQSDVLFSTAMMAFYEAITNYDAEKGHFFPFADRVVRSRLIDQVRSINRSEASTVSLDEEDEEQKTAQSAVITEISMRNYNKEHRQEMLLDEIEQFKAEIETWGITMEMLAKSSPKHKQLRKAYYDVLSTVLGDQEIMQTILLKRYFPAKAISNITGLPLNKLERARIFIISTIIIKMGDYDLLSDFLHR